MERMVDRAQVMLPLVRALVLKKMMMMTQDDSKIKRKGDTDGISSITTKQTKAERNLYILRIAIDEKFIPQSIKNLRYAANIVFMILLLLASKISTYRLFIVIYYAIQISLFDLIN
jgi:hypothetical protein